MALYVKCTSPAGQNWAGSNISIPLDGTTNVVLEAFSVLPADKNPTTSIAAADINWTILNGPEGTAWNSARFVLANGGTLAGVNPLTSAAAPGPFIPDKPGTWLIRCTRVSTSESVDVVVGVLQERSGIRVPAAGETNEADTDVGFHSYPTLPSGSPAAMGWAKDRNYALELVDELITSGALQLYWFEDTIPGVAPWSGTLKAGAAVSLTGTLHTLTGKDVTGDAVSIPKVGFAHGTNNPDCVGLVYCGWKVPASVPSGGGVAADQRVYPKVVTKTEIPNQSLILVSRSGAVTGAVSGILDNAAVTPGEILYLSDIPGLLQRGTDRFAMAAMGGSTRTDYVVPVAIAAIASNPGTVTVIPSEYWGGLSTASGDQCFRYKGLGDFRGLRVGGPESTQVAGEMCGAIEMIATCKESGGLTVGDVCMLYPDSAGAINTAHLADAQSTGYPISGGNMVRTSGIVGICVQDVAFDAVGHFVIYGPAEAKLSALAVTQVGANYALSLYVGTNDVPVGGVGTRGKCVLFSEVGNRPPELLPCKMIPVGCMVPQTTGGTTEMIMVGMGQHDGYVATAGSGQVQQSTERVEGAWASGNKGRPNGAYTGSFKHLLFQDGTNTLTPHGGSSTSSGTYQDGRTSQTVTKLAGTGADDSLGEIDLFEAKLPGTALATLSVSDVTALAGTIDTSAVNKVPAAKLDAAGVGANKLIGTFCFDKRLYYADPTDLLAKDAGEYDNEVYLKVYGYTIGTATSVQLRSRVRFNAVSTSTSGPTGNTLATGYPYVVTMINQRPGGDSVYTADAAGATYIREFGILCPLTDYSTFSAATNYAAPIANPNLGILSPRSNTNTTVSTNDNGRWAGDFSALIETVDIVLENESVVDFYVTQVVLQSRRRLIPVGSAGLQADDAYRPTTYYESSYPAYAFLAYDVTGGTDGVFKIQDKGPSIVASPGTAPSTGGSLARLATIAGIPNCTDGSTGDLDYYNVYGFIPLDPRMPLITGGTNKLVFSLYGKLACPTPGTDQLGLKLEIVEITKDSSYNKTIASAAGVQTIYATIVPVPADPASDQVSVTRHDFELATGPGSSNVIGYWFKVTRVDNTTGGDANDRLSMATEQFWVMTNIRLEPKYNTSNSARTTTTYKPEAIYEQHIPATSLVERDSGAFYKYVDSDVSGALLQQSGVGPRNTLYFTAALDERYDDKSGLVVEVIFCISNTAGSNDPKLKLQCGYKNCKEITSTSNLSAVYTQNLFEEEVTNTGSIPANEYRYLRAQFFVNPDTVWDQAADVPDGYSQRYNSPNMNSSRDKGSVRFSLMRTDTNTYDAAVLSVVVRGMRANKTKLSTIRPAYVDTTGARVATYPSTDLYRSLDLSIQRKTLKFVVSKFYSQGAAPGSLNPLANTNSTCLLTPYLASMTSASNALPVNANATDLFGHFISHSFAITAISGWIGTLNSGGATFLSSLAAGAVQLDIFVSEILTRTGSGDPGPSASANLQAKIWPQRPAAGAGTGEMIAFPGVQGLPVSISPAVGSGVINWRPGQYQSAQVTSGSIVSRKMPKVILPNGYRELGPAVTATDTVYPWQLTCTLTNTSGGDLYPIGEIDIEIAIIPSIQNNVYTYSGNPNEPNIGGAPSSGWGHPKP